ncbi:putative mfs maltose permease [Phaeomoniella chlamydospora]|uniref:Putative mfs maltose permease n=1 Tax=Phaeomoniella chlamydospora TaxID=158046 RepID=A0A0G2GCF4_PHACM|nr:putative mfs maltose permease [Phaeomoniella chlamydospora]
MRNRKDAEYSDEYRHGALNWDFLGKGYLELLERLERGADSKDVKEVEEGGILIEGVGKAGYDVSSKSGTWKQGYFEALMGAAKVAENLDGWVKNKDGKSLSFPREMVPSPENPEPALIPVNWRGTPPRIEDAISAFESPATFYAKVLTTRGLTTRMKTEAALAWADWLDFKGLHGTAEEVLKWGLDIASQGMNASQLSDVLDMKRSNLKVKGSLRVSENMLKTCTALAVHHARSGSVEKALSLFLSIMKIRKDLASKMAPVMELPQVPEETDFVESVMQLIRGPGYPPIPSSGDEPPNDALKEACEQTGIMAYIGEILYATSSKEEGLSWTRDAVDGAEQVLSAMQGQASQAGKEKCEECLETGLLNWQEMASSLAALEYTSGQKEPKSSWFGVWKKREHDEDRWAREQEQIQLRIERTKPFLKERFGQVQVVSPS